MDELVKKFSDMVSNEEADQEEKIEKLLKERQSKRKGALVFCVSCGAVKRTLRRWHNSYLCTDCYKIAQEVGDEKFIAALKGEKSD